MNGKIEEGCRAVIVNSVAGNNGTVVTIGKYVGEDEYDSGEVDRTWKIDINLKDSGGFLDNEIGEYQLQRIDYDGNETTTWESMADIWNPVVEHSS